MGAGGAVRGDAERLVTLGRITGLYGVRGWVRVASDTEPRENILAYRPWQIGSGESWREARVAEGRVQGKGVVARLEGCSDRDAAAALLGCAVAVHRDQLPPPAPGEYYWADLEGLTVRTTAGVELGRVERVLATGANDVLVVRGERERLVPFVRGEVIRAVDLEGGWLEVDWDPEF